MNKTHLLPLLVIALVAGCTTASAVIYPELHNVDVGSISLPLLGRMLLSLGAMIAAALSALPAEVVAIGNGMSFGPIIGFALTWSGGLAGACIGFFVARLIGRQPILRFVSAKRIATLDVWIERHGISVLLLARLIPFVPFFVLNYGAGLTNLRFSSYLWITAIGIIPMSLLCVILGNRVLEADWQAVFLVTSAALLLMALAYWLRAWRPVQPE